MFSRITIISLTDEQQRQIAPLMELVSAISFTNRPGMIIGQVFQDKIICGFVDHEYAAILSALSRITILPDDKETCPALRLVNNTKGVA